MYLRAKGKATRARSPAIMPINALIASTVSMMRMGKPPGARVSWGFLAPST
jgi:hypothetical protein